MDESLEVVTWKVEVVGPPPPLQSGYRVTGSGNAATASEARKGRRTCGFGGSLVEASVYDRYALIPGQTIIGPALIEERESTCVITPGNRATVDNALNIVAELEA